MTGISDLPIDLWEQIICKIDHVHDRHLQSLSLVCTHLLSITNRLKQTLIIFDPTVDLLPSLFRRFPNLKHISLSYFTGDPVPVLLQIADFGLQIETLHLPYQVCPSVQVLEGLPPSILGAVKALNIHHLGDDDLEMIPSFFPNLEELDLWPPDVDDDDFDEDCYSPIPPVSPNHYYKDGIPALASNLKGLKRINLERSQILISLSENCPNMEEIVVRLNGNGDEYGIQFALSSLEKLKSLSLHGYSDPYYDDGGWNAGYRDGWNVNVIREPLCSARSLAKIDLHNVIVSDALLRAMADAYLPLESFTMSRCKWRFTHQSCNSILPFLKTYDSLDCLALEDVGFLSDEFMVNLTRYLAKVRVLKLNRCVALSELTLFTVIGDCPLLETVEMKQTQIGRGIEKDRASVLSSHIRTLKLSKNNLLSDKSLNQIASACPNLEMLHLRSCPLLNDKAMIVISRKCPHLRFLNVMNCEALTARGVTEVVERCIKLKEINLQGLPISSGDFLSWIVFCVQNLRVVIPPARFLDRCDESLYLRRGRGYYVKSRGYYAKR